MGLGRSALYGESIFTSFRTIEGQVPGWDFHLERLFSSVADYFFCSRRTIEELQNYYLPLDMPEMFNKFPNHYFRLTFTSESNALVCGLGEVNLKLDCREIGEISAVPIRLMLTESPYSFAQLGVKSGSYFQSFALKKRARLKGMDDVLFTQDNFLTEASTSSVVFKNGEELITPFFQGGLESISLKNFSQFCEQAGISLSSRPVKKSELSQFDAGFILNSVQLIKPIGSVNQFSYSIDDKLDKSFKKYLGVK